MFALDLSRERKHFPWLLFPSSADYSATLEGKFFQTRMDQEENLQIAKKGRR